jgi:hypothetical protein
VKGTIRSYESRQKVSKGNTGKKRSAEFKAKMAAICAARTGWKHTPEAKEKMGAAKRGRKLSPEHIAKATIRRMEAKDAKKGQLSFVLTQP